MRIIVKNNKRIEHQTIESYLPIRVGDNIDIATLDKCIKDLFETGYFKDVKASFDKGVLIITVDENPSINQIQFEGNSKLKDEDIKKFVTLKAREILSNAKVQVAQQHLLESYRRMGRYQAKVDVKIIRLDQNRVNLVFEIDEGKPVYVKTIRFLGNKSFSRSRLLEQLKTKEYVFYRFWATDDCYDPERFLSDQQQIEKFYNNNGYPHMRIASAICELSQDQGSFTMTYTIDEGDRYAFGDTTISCAVSAIKKEDLDKAIVYQKGDHYSKRFIEATSQLLKQVVASKGYAFIDVDVKETYDDKNKRVNISYQVKEGAKVRVERIDIVGNDRTRDHVIRRELDMHEGDAYDAQKVKKAESDIKDLGYFKEVTVDTQRGSSEDLARVRIKVEEQPTGEISGGVSYSTLDKFGLTAGLKEYNIMGTGRIFETTATLSKGTQGVSLGLTDPRLFDRHLQGTVSVFGNRSSRTSAFKEMDLGTTVGISYPLSQFWSHQVSVTFQGSRVTGLPSDGSLIIKDQAKNSFKTLLSHALTYSTLNSYINPTRGFKWSFGNGLAGLLGNVSYLQTTTSIVTYYGFGEEEQYVIKLSAECGMISGLRGRKVRMVDSFQMGGDNMRGFAYDGIGPRDMGGYQHLSPFTGPYRTVSDKDCIRGTRMYRLSGELKFPLGAPKEWGIHGVLFMDVGASWKPGQSSSKNMSIPGKDTRPPVFAYTNVKDSKSPRVTAGPGVVWHSPFGTIGVFYGYALKKQWFDETQRLFISFAQRF